MCTLACSHILDCSSIFFAGHYNKARPKLLPNFLSVVRNCLVSEQKLLSPTFWLGSCTCNKNLPILSKTIASYFVRPAGLVFKICPGSFLFLLPFARLGKTFFCSWILCFMPMWTAAESRRCGNLAPAAWWKNVRVLESFPHTMSCMVNWFNPMHFWICEVEYILHKVRIKSSNMPLGKSWVVLFGPWVCSPCRSYLPQVKRTLAQGNAQFILPVLHWTTFSKAMTWHISARS